MPSRRKSSPEPGKRLVASLAGPVGLLGLGVEGRETLAFLAAHGLNAAHLVDRRFGANGAADPVPPGLRARYHGEETAPAVLGACRTVVRSPGVRPDHPGLEAARAAGALVTSATALFLGACAARTVGVTGTVGKGTTTTLVGEALAAAGVPHVLAGNIGTNPLTFLDDLTPDHVAVLELSSFQLMDLPPELGPDVAVVLRTSAEHQDWHRSVTEYRVAKGGLLRRGNPAQTVICCADSPGSRAVVGARWDDALHFSTREPVITGIGLGKGGLARFRKGQAELLPGLARLTMPGAFNAENAAAAWLAAEALGVPGESAAAAIAAFPGLPHRLERVGTLNGVTCYNDSYATRPDATAGAVASFSEPLALILGGSEKFADFSELVALLCRHPSLRRVVLLGQTADRLAQELDAAARGAGGAPQATRAGDLPEAVTLALEGLPAGGVLLFSPACASFDMFSNYKVRGEMFRELIRTRQR